ncbi:hypothetical protein OTU49_007421, partial [Cherax quadricarinatus]
LVSAKWTPVQRAAVSPLLGKISGSVDSYHCLCLTCRELLSHLSKGISVAQWTTVLVRVIRSLVCCLDAAVCLLSQPPFSAVSSGSSSAVRRDPPGVVCAEPSYAV